MNHPNRLPFEGVLTVVDQASDRAPTGARGHKVLLTRHCARMALPGLEGMAVDFRDDWDGHDERQKCGIITSAWLHGPKVLVAGYLFCRDFRELQPKLEREAGRMGMSYELADAHVEDLRAEVWVVTRAEFTGAAILLRDRAAYRQTSFALVRGPLELAAETECGVELKGCWE